MVAHSLVFVPVPHSLAKWNNAGNRYFLISVVKLFLNYSLCVTYVITVKSVRDIDVKPTWCICVFWCFPVGESGDMLPQKILVAYILYSHTSNIDGSIQS